MSHEPTIIIACSPANRMLFSNLAAQCLDRTSCGDALAYRCCTDIYSAVARVLSGQRNGSPHFFVVELDFLSSEEIQAFTVLSSLSNLTTLAVLVSQPARAKAAPALAAGCHRVVIVDDLANTLASLCHPCVTPLPNQTASASSPLSGITSSLDASNETAFSPEAAILGDDREKAADSLKNESDAVSPHQPVEPVKLSQEELDILLGD